MNTKVYIIGGLGSGKSYFAKKLSEKIGVPYFDIDQIVFKESRFDERTESERNAIFENIFKKDSWILEGTFTEDWIIPGLEASSRIIYLTTPPAARLYRFIKRILKQGILKQNDLLGRTKLVLGFKHKEWDRTANKYEEVLALHKNKVITLKSKKEVVDFIDAQKKEVKLIH